MVALLPEALHLYDLIRSTAVDVYNSDRRKGGHLRIVEKKVGHDGKAVPDAWRGLHKTAKGYAAEVENRRLRAQLEKARERATA